jgi:hypothetical protein
MTDIANTVVGAGSALHALPALSGDGLKELARFVQLSRPSTCARATPRRMRSTVLGTVRASRSRFVNLEKCAEATQFPSTQPRKRGSHPTAATIVVIS